MEIARKHKVKHLLMSSTSSVYGANTEMPFTETEKADTQLTIYAATKKSNESMAHSYSHLWKIPITCFVFLQFMDLGEDLIWHIFKFVIINFK
jgi:UDP-glucuronate 4-epimerase